MWTVRFLPWDFVTLEKKNMKLIQTHTDHTDHTDSYKLTYFFGNRWFLQSVDRAFFSWKNTNFPGVDTCKSISYEYVFRGLVFMNICIDNQNSYKLVSGQLPPRKIAPWMIAPILLPPMKAASRKITSSKLLPPDDCPEDNCPLIISPRIAIRNCISDDFSPVYCPSGNCHWEQLSPPPSQ